MIKQFLTITTAVLMASCGSQIEQQMATIGSFEQPDYGERPDDVSDDDATGEMPGDVPPSTSPVVVATPKPWGKKLSGFMKSSDGTTINLAHDDNLPTILMISATWCGPCKDEIASIKKSLVDKINGPSKVKLYTVFVDMQTASSAESWRKALPTNNPIMPWKVGYTNELGKMCTGGYPCILINTPEDGVVYRRAGGMGVSAMKQYTGAWE